MDSYFKFRPLGTVASNSGLSQIKPKVIGPLRQSHLTASVDEQPKLRKLLFFVLQTDSGAEVLYSHWSVIEELYMRC